MFWLSVREEDTAKDQGSFSAAAEYILRKHQWIRERLWSVKRRSLKGKSPFLKCIRWVTEIILNCSKKITNNYIFFASFLGSPCSLYVVFRSTLTSASSVQGWFNQALPTQKQKRGRRRCTMKLLMPEGNKSFSNLPEVQSTVWESWAKFCIK